MIFRRDPSRTLADRLVQLRIVTPAQLEHAREVAADKSPEALVEALEKLALVTAFQAGRLRANDFDALVVGDYKLTYRNAEGSFARVYRAESLKDGRVVALKLLRGRHAGDPRAVAQFRKEALVVRKLVHKNIVPIYDLGSSGDSHYFTMEFVEGGNLKEFLSIRKKLSVEEATRYTLDVAEGLEFALANGVTHRDLKLSNVLITTSGVAKLVDFGLAGQDAPGGSAELRALEYAVLEKETDAPTDDPRSDVFFLGAIYYELLVGTPPWPYTSDRQERKSVARYRDVKPVRQADPSLPKRAAEIVEKLMSWDPDRRYQTPGEAAADLRAFLAELGGEESAKPAPAPAAAAKPAGKPDPTVLCVESSHKRQDMLREYLSKRGFRPLFLTDPGRALARLDSNPPDAVIVMGESLGDELFDFYPKVQAVTAEVALVAVFVLAESQKARRDELDETPVCRVLAPPLSARDLRRALMAGLKHVLTESRLIKLPPLPESG